MREIFGGNGSLLLLLKAPPTNFSSACLQLHSSGILTVILYFPHSFSTHNLEVFCMEDLSLCPVYLFMHSSIYFGVDSCIFILFWGL